MNCKSLIVGLFSIVLFFTFSQRANAQSDFHKSAGASAKPLAPFRATTDQIKAAQKILKDGKMYSGEETGKLDEPTRDGLKKYQETNGVKITGTLNAVTLEKMGIPLTDLQKPIPINPTSSIELPKPTPQVQNGQKSFEGVVVDTDGGPRWIGIIVESNGRKYTVVIDNPLFPPNPKLIGDIDGFPKYIGARVRVAYRKINEEKDGTLWVDATVVTRLPDKPVASEAESTMKVSNGSLPISLFNEIFRDESVKECAESIERSYGDYAATFFEITSLDLDGDGQNEFLVSVGGPCFGASGSYYLLYRRVETRWQKLGSFGGNQVSINAAKTISNGFRDMVVKSGSLSDKNETTFKFDGREYQSCANNSYNRPNPDARWKLTGSTSSNCAFVKKEPPISGVGYVDIIEPVGSGCRIRIIAGDKSYTGIVGFDRLSALTRQRIRSYDDALAFFEGKQINVTLSGIAASDDSISTGSFGRISRMTVLPKKTRIKPQQRWNERTTATETIIGLSTDILFDFNKSTINPNAVPSLIRLARLLRQSNSGAVQLNGFTDSIGTDEYNIGLSERRSDAVKQWLVTKGGIDAGRLATNGYGKSQPVAPNTNPDGSDNPTGRQKNRRVEIRIPNR